MVAVLGAMGLPEGVTLGMVVAVLVPAAVVTFLLRALPFSLLKLLQASPLIEFLGLLMPVGVMMVLQGWKRRADVSIVAGTAVYMLLVNLW